ncbi:MAG: DUF3810 domain-containing protein [Clostridiales bacterium]|nr:DUF3810 domain-containing protein [Clostridiales bacterium]
MKKIVSLKRIWLLLCIPAALALTLTASYSPAFAEWYAVTVYPALSRAVNFIASLLPVSVAELAALCLLPAILVYLFFALRRIVRRKGERALCACKSAVSILCAVSVVYASYALLCGINYHRYPFAQVSGLSVQASPVDQLEGLCAELAETASSLREQIKEDSSGVAASSFADSFQVAREAQTAYDKLAARFPTLTRGYGQPKPVVASRLMSYCQITGIFIPFTCEANVNVDIPYYNLPSTMCHELTHLRGYMREDEANFIAYLASLQSDSPDFQYSGVMLAYAYVENALYRADQQAWREASALLSDGVRRDLAANSAYWKQFEGPVAEISSQVNDSYLKANKQEDGVKSYGRMVDLLLADYRQRHGLTL